jgi:hypothetical protein
VLKQCSLRRATGERASSGDTLRNCARARSGPRATRRATLGEGSAERSPQLEDASRPFA